MFALNEINEVFRQIEKIELKLDMLDEYTKIIISSTIGVLSLVIALLTIVLGSAGYFLIHSVINHIVNTEIEEKVTVILREKVRTYQARGSDSLNDKNQIILNKEIEGIEFLTPESIIRLDYKFQDFRWVDLDNTPTLELLIDDSGRRVISFQNIEGWQGENRVIDWEVVWSNLG